MILAIQSTSPEESRVIIANGVTHRVKQAPVRNGKRGDILAAVDSLLRSQKKTIASLAGIIVVTGPGHFSHLRTGISIANAIGFALGVPVVGVAADQFSNDAELIKKGTTLLKKTKLFRPVMPMYGKEPSITKPKHVTRNT